jgi:hypothetical protein
MPLLPESDLELNWKDIEKFLIFLTVICTPRYDKLFRSYEILKWAGLLELWADQIWAIWEFQTFESNPNKISESFQYQTRS